MFTYIHETKHKPVIRPIPSLPVGIHSKDLIVSIWVQTETHL